MDGVDSKICLKVVPGINHNLLPLTDCIENIAFNSSVIAGCSVAAGK
jgi:hypothetical protein